jgi:FtsP/CotA-like multicopper oxidase with cupredoxin domain
MEVTMSAESNGSTKSNNSIFANSMLGMMMIAVAVSALVLGVVAVVAMNGGSSTESASGSSVVQVTLSEFKVVFNPGVITAGDVTFVVTNSGAVDHNFAIPSLNIRTAMLRAGEVAKLEVKGIEVGEVEYLCEVAGHSAAGMTGLLSVVESGGDTGMAMSDNPMASTVSWQQMDKMMEDVAMKFPAKTSGTGNTELPYTIADDGYKVFTLTAKVIPWEVEAGKFVDGWSYNGLIPGPVMHANVGDKIRIVLNNELPESTSLHLHGVRVPNAMDGVDPYTQKPIEPGASFTYEWTALEPSVGMYHSHHNAQVQVPNGLAGAILIGDWKTMAMAAAGGRTHDANKVAEQEVVMVLNDSGTIGLSLNGKSFPATSPYSLAIGETMVVHYYNEGSMTHPMHLHQPSGLVVAKDGKVLESPFWADTINVAPGERWTVVYTPKDVGVWAWHCHILTHAETPEGMRYMVTALIVK